MIERKPSIVLVDDHVLLRNGLANLIESFSEFEILFQSDNGKQFIKQLKTENIPDIVLLDINMPEMNGYETASWLKLNFPEIKILALSMYDNDNAIIQMLKMGARGYVLKDIEPRELKDALHSVLEKGFYYSEMITGTLINNINNQKELKDSGRNTSFLSEKEIEFLKLVCTEKTYKEIADCMFLSPRTIDGYRDELFEKLNVKSRVGLVMYTIKNGIIDL